MNANSRWAPSLVCLVAVASLPNAAEAQGRGNSRPESVTQIDVSHVHFTAEVGDAIRLFYDARPAYSAQALPPGIRRNLARGKPLPPGIAKKIAPPELVTLIHLPSGYEVVEVGLDVLLVEVATNIVHDVLMDVIR